MNRYSLERKESVLKKLLPPHNLSVAELSRQEGISDVTLYTWRKQAKAKGSAEHGGGRGRTEEDPQARSRLEEGEDRERPFKKSYPVQFGTKADRFAFIDRHHQEYGVTFLCRYYGVSRSGYYAWKRRPLSPRCRANQQLVLGREDFKDKIERMTARQTRLGQNGRPRTGAAEEPMGEYYVF